MQTPPLRNFTSANIFAVKEEKEKRMTTAKLTLLGLLLLSFGTSCAGHDGHDEDQMPLNYVRYPYQAVYPGDDSGKSCVSLPC